MKIIRPVAFPVAIILLCIGISHAQRSRSNSATVTPRADLATIYICRLDTGTTVMTPLIKTMPVYVGQEVNSKVIQRNVANLRDRRYFIIHLPEGKYTFDTRSMPGKIFLDVTAGSVYYLKLEHASGCPYVDPEDPYPACMFVDPSILGIKPQYWSEFLRFLSPIESKDIKDKSMVIIPPPRTPAGQGKGNEK